VFPKKRSTEIQLRWRCGDTKFRAGGREKFKTRPASALRAPDGPRTGPATRVEHLSDTLRPVGPLFSHRFRLGKHGFNRCFTRSIPGTGSSIWDPRLAASESWARRAQEEARGHSRARRAIEREGVKRGPRYTRCPGLRAHFACQAQFRLGPETLELSLFGVAVYGRHYLDRPRVGLNDLFVCTRSTLLADVSYVIFNVALVRRRAM